MSADRVIVFYGIRLQVPGDDECAISALESRTDPHLVAARAAKLDTWWGRLTDGEDYHLLIGRKIGVFGVDDAAEKQMPLAELSKLADKTDAMLSSVGFAEQGSLLFQLEAQD